MKYFNIYQNHLKGLSKKRTLVYVSHLSEELKNNITELLGDSCQITDNPLDLSGTTADIIISYDGFIEELFLNLSSTGIFISIGSTKEDIFQSLSRNNFIEFVNTTKFIHEYPELLVFEKSPSVGSLSGTYK